MPQMSTTGFQIRIYITIYTRVTNGLGLLSAPLAGTCKELKSFLICRIDLVKMKQYLHFMG